MCYLLTPITCHCVRSRVNVVEQVHVASLIYYCYLATLYVRTCDIFQVYVCMCAVVCTYISVHVHACMRT